MSWVDDFDADGPQEETETEDDVILPAELDPKQPFKEKVRKLLELHADDEAKQAAAKASRKAFKAHELALHIEMEQAGDESRKVDLGQPWGTYTLTPNDTIRGRVLDDDAFQEYLENRAMVDETVTTKYRGRRINELADQLVRGGQELPPGFDFTRTRYITKTKAKPKKKKRA